MCMYVYKCGEHLWSATYSKAIHLNFARSFFSTLLRSDIIKHFSGAVLLLVDENGSMESQTNLNTTFFLSAVLERCKRKKNSQRNGMEGRRCGDEDFLLSIDQANKSCVKYHRSMLSVALIQNRSNWRRANVLIHTLNSYSVNHTQTHSHQHLYTTHYTRLWAIR